MKNERRVDSYIEHAAHWQDELVLLRDILRTCDLEETIKWGVPCYTHGGKNVVGLGAFKSYVGLWFFQGVRLADPDGVLINAQEGKTKSMRQWRFTTRRDIRTRRIRAYVKEAIELLRHDAARPPAPRRTKPLRLPPELKSALDQAPRTRAAFDALTPGRRREYADHVAEAKREATRLSRVEKILPMIRAGRGLNDRYR